MLEAETMATASASSRDVQGMTVVFNWQCRPETPTIPLWQAEFGAIAVDQWFSVYFPWDGYSGDEVIELQKASVAIPIVVSPRLFNFEERCGPVF